MQKVATSLDRVVDREGVVDRATGAVDVELDVLASLLILEVEHLHHHSRRGGVVDLADEEHDAILEQKLVDRHLTSPLIADGGSRFDSALVEGRGSNEVEGGDMVCRMIVHGGSVRHQGEVRFRGEDHTTLSHPPGDESFNGRIGHRGPHLESGLDLWCQRHPIPPPEWLEGSF